MYLYITIKLYVLIEICEGYYLLIVILLTKSQEIKIINNL